MSDKQVVRAGGARVRPTVARHGRQKRARAWKAVLGLIGGTVAVVLVSGSALAGITVWQTADNIETEAIGSDLIGPPPSIGAIEGGFNILIVGSDTRQGQGGLGGYESSTLNDVNMLLHVAEDQQSATLVSLPRDLVVPIPRCENGGPATGLPINETLYYGGLSCTVETVENVTGLKIQFAGLITFRGVIAMSNAVGGVEVCTDGPIMDPWSGLKIRSAGTHELSGSQALAFLRSRKGVGDGSDLGRISSQQVFLSSLVRKIKSEDTLGDLGKVYGLASAATKNMTLSKNFSRPDTLVQIALALKDIPLENIVMVQYPSTTGVGGIYTGKVAPLQAQADALFAAIKKDAPIRLDAQALNNRGAVELNPKAPKKPKDDATPKPSDSATPKPSSTVKPITVSGVKGQSADQYTCSKAY